MIFSIKESVNNIKVLIEFIEHKKSVNGFMILYTILLLLYFLIYFILYRFFAYTFTGMNHGIHLSESII